MAYQEVSESEESVQIPPEPSSSIPCVYYVEPPVFSRAWIRRERKRAKCSNRCAFGTCAITMLWATSIQACLVYVSWMMNTSLGWDSVNATLSSQNTQLDEMRFSYRTCVDRRASECNASIQLEFSVLVADTSSRLQTDTEVTIPATRQDVLACESWIRNNASASFSETLPVETLLELRNQTIGFLDQYANQTVQLLSAYQTLASFQLLQSRILVSIDTRVNVTNEFLEFVAWLDTTKLYRTQFDTYLDTCFGPSSDSSTTLSQRIAQSKALSISGLTDIENQFVQAYSGFIQRIFEIADFTDKAMQKVDAFGKQGLDKVLTKVQDYTNYEHKTSPGGSAFATSVSDMIQQTLPAQWDSVYEYSVAEAKAFASAIQRANQSTVWFVTGNQSAYLQYIQRTYFPDYNHPLVNDTFLVDVSESLDTFRYSVSDTFQNTYVQTSQGLNSALQHVLDSALGSANLTVFAILNQSQVESVSRAYLEEAVAFADASLHHTEQAVVQEFPSLDHILASFPFTFSSSLLVMWILPALDFLYRYVHTIRLINRFVVSSSTTAPIADTRVQDPISTSALTGIDVFSKKCSQIYTVFLSPRNAVCMARMMIIILLFLFVTTCVLLNSVMTPVYEKTCGSKSIEYEASVSGVIQVSNLASVNLITENWYQYARQYVFSDGDASYSAYIDTVNTARYRMCTRFVAEIAYPQYRNRSVYDSLLLQMDSLRRLLESAGVHPPTTICEASHSLQSPRLMDLETCLSCVSDCDLACAPPEEDRIKQTVAPMGCSVQSYGLYQMRYSVLFVTLFIWLNISRDGFVSGMRRIFVEQLAPQEFRYTGTCDASGKVIHPASSASLDTYASVVKLSTKVAITTHKWEGVIEILSSIVVFVMGGLSVSYALHVVGFDIT